MRGPPSENSLAPKLRRNSRGRVEISSADCDALAVEGVEQLPGTVSGLAEALDDRPQLRERQSQQGEWFGFAHGIPVMAFRWAAARL